MDVWLARRKYVGDDPANGIEYLGWPQENDLGWLLTDFEAWEPDERFPWAQRKAARDGEWPIVVPVKAPPVPPDLPAVMQKMVAATWKYTQPARDVQRGKAGIPADGHERADGTKVERWNEMYIGTRGMPQPLFKQFNRPDNGYRTQVRPTGSVMQTVMPNKDAIASDWALHGEMERVNAVTFRADKRSPVDVIVKARGFHPPNTRADRNYISNRIAVSFASYLRRRYGRDVDANEILRVIDRDITSTEDRDLLNEYMVWFSLVSKESAHLARMVDYEFEKGWTSTSKSLTRSMTFVAFGGTPGWMYVTMVHGGFVVPYDGRGDEVWSSAEAEIAKFGPVRADHIVGFVHFDPHSPDTPIFMRKGFRKDEPKAFKAMHQALSGAPSTAL